MFTFDLPAELFERYAANGVLTRRAALNLREDVFPPLTPCNPQKQTRSSSFGKITPLTQTHSRLNLNHRQSKYSHPF
jgi:hypothetical protein